jgi:hypothetical protein
MDQIGAWKRSKGIKQIVQNVQSYVVQHHLIVDKLMLAENTLVIGRPREFLEVSSISK